MIFFDLETFQDTICHVPYACGYSVGDHKNVNISYGKNCMDSLVDHLLTVNEKVICAYNGSGFDFYLLLNQLKDRGVEIKNIIMFNGSILSFKFGEDGKENKVFDLYKFINDNLKDACEAYKIENKKMEFDVLKIKS
jgi:DNA polymerase elongation subunit (family B)